MLILGHVGGAVALSTLAEKRFNIRPDYRLVIPIALGPDIMDKLFYLFFFQELKKGKFLGHTLLFGLALCGLLYLWRREWLIYGLVWLLHLPCDALWLAPETFLWPLLGWRFSDWEAGPYLPFGFLFLSRVLGMLSNYLDLTWLPFEPIGGLLILISLLHHKPQAASSQQNVEE